MKLRLVVLFLVLLAPLGVQANLRGHGGPVRALAVSPDGHLAVSGSFDQSAILWDLQDGSALAVWRFHDGAVNAVAALPDGRFATGGEDGRIALWRPQQGEPDRVIEGHTGPVVSLAVSPDGTLIASASWDGTARVTPLADSGRARVLEGHQGNVNAVAFMPDGRVVTAGYDATLRIWPAAGEAAVHRMPAPLNCLAVAPDGTIVTAGADGNVRILRADGSVSSEIGTGPTPVIALALSPDGQRVAAASIGGSVTLINRVSARVQFSLVGPGLPVWSVAFLPDGSELLTGGSDRVVRRWNMRTGEPIGAVVLTRPDDGIAPASDDRGAQVFRACAACHTLTPEGGNRAGPSLHGVFGRRIATAPGYNFSPALKQLDIVWTPETVARLFEVGPAQYTPGTKMPEQVIRDAQDREALVRFLEQATKSP